MYRLKFSEKLVFGVSIAIDIAEIIVKNIFKSIAYLLRREAKIFRR
jgi:hypothetical protein